MSDPRRDPTTRPPGRATTGERLISARETLDAIAPLPTVPPESERASNPNLVLEYMRDLHESDRTVSAYLAGQLQEQDDKIEGLKLEFDGLLGKVVALDAKVERLEDRSKIISNTQITQNAELAGLKRGIARDRQITEGAINNLAVRVSAVESRQDSFEKSFGEFRELVLADIDRRRKELDAAAARTPRLPDAASDPEGPART